MAQLYFVPERSFFAIKGINMPSPKSCVMTYQDFDSDLSTRATDGTMVRDRITTKRKLELQWAPLTPDDVSLIINTVWTPLEYTAISYDRVMMPSSYDEFYALTLSEQNELINRIHTYTGVSVNSNDFYSDNDYRQKTLDRIDDGLALHNAEMNDKVFFEVTFFDPRMKQYTNMKVYRGDINVSDLFAYPIESKNSNSTDLLGRPIRRYYQDLKFSLIEK